MAEVLLLNPRRRRRKNPKARKRRSSRRVALRANPKRRRRRSNPYLINPRRRHRARRRNPYLINPRRRRRRNPSLRSIGGEVMPTLKAGFTGALGALGLDVALGYGAQYIPASLNSGLPLQAVKLLAAVLVGYVGNKVPGLKGHGKDLAVGAATVVIHDSLKSQVASMFPSIPLSGYFNVASFGGSPVVGTPVLTTGMGRYDGTLGRLGVYQRLNGLSGLSQNVSEHGEYNDGIY